MKQGLIFLEIDSLSDDAGQLCWEFSTFIGGGGSPPSHSKIPQPTPSLPFGRRRGGGVEGAVYCVQGMSIGVKTSFNTLKHIYDAVKKNWGRD